MLPKRRWIVFVFIFSFFVNALMLTGPIYMLQVYDRVLSSRSLDTLWALTVLMIAMFAFMGAFDHIRSRTLSRWGVGWSGVIRSNVNDQKKTFNKTREALSDAETIARGYSSPAMLGALDIVWTPLFLVFLYLLHPLICLATFSGLLISTLLAAGSALTSAKKEKTSLQSMTAANTHESLMVRDNATLEDLSIWDKMRETWINLKDTAEGETLKYQDLHSGWTTLTKTYRLAFQSCILGLGAYLAVVGDVTPGAMIAGSILAGRALAPIDQVLGGLPLLIKTRRAWVRSRPLMDTKNSTPAHTPTPQAGHLDVNGVFLQTPGEKAILANISFTLKPGECVAIIGESGSGKTSLARLISGVWPPTVGTITLDAIATNQAAQSIGFVPQGTHLPDATLMDLARRFDQNIPEEDVYEMARKLEVQDIINTLAKGYNTPVSQGGTSLPMTARRAVLLIQAFVGDKKLIVLDDPSAHLSPRLVYALKKVIHEKISENKSIVLISDNLDLLTTSSHFLILEKGRGVAFGEALKVVDSYLKSAKNSAQPMSLPFALAMAMRRREQHLMQQSKKAEGEI